MTKKQTDTIVFIEQKFSDFEQLMLAAKKWNLNFHQLDTGKLEGKMLLLDTVQIQLGTVNFNRKIEQRGITPKGYRTFAIPADSKQYFKWRNYHITGNNLMLFPRSGEIDAVNYPGFRVFTFSLNAALIQSLLGATEDQFSALIPMNAQVLELSSQNMSLLRQTVSYVFRNAELDPGLVNKPVFKRLILKEVPSVLLRSLQTPDSKPKLEKSRIRDISLKKATAFLDSCSTDYPTVYELCLIAGGSQRTLEYAFKEKYGISPQNYIKKLKLNRVRLQLKATVRGKGSVNKIAQAHGFSHHGQFAADYKKMFGELPSVTINKPY